MNARERYGYQPQRLIYHNYNGQGREKRRVIETQLYEVPRFFTLMSTILLFHIQYALYNMERNKLVIENLFSVFGGTRPGAKARIFSLLFYAFVVKFQYKKIAFLCHPVR